MFDLPPVTPPAVEVVVATDASRWGVSKTDGNAFVGATATWQRGDFTFGAEINNADYYVDADNEVVVFGGVTGQAAGFDLRVGAEYRKLNGSTLSDDEAIQFSASAARDFGPVRGTLAVGYAPDDFAGEEDTYFVEASAAYRFGNNELSAGYGRKFGGDFQYDAWNVGYARNLTDKVAVDVRYFETDQQNFGRAFDDRVVASLRVKF